MAGISEYLNWKNFLYIIIFILIVQALAQIFNNSTYKNISSTFDSLTGIAASAAEAAEKCFDNGGVNFINPTKCPLGFTAILGSLLGFVAKTAIALRGSGNPLVEQNKFLTQRDAVSIIKDAYKKSVTKISDIDLDKKFRSVNGKDPTPDQRILARSADTLNEIQQDSTKSLKSSNLDPDNIIYQTEMAKQNTNDSRTMAEKRIRLSSDQINEVDKVHPKDKVNKTIIDNYRRK